MNLFSFIILGTPYGDISELLPTQCCIYEKQKQIGWNAFLKGFWSTEWATVRILCFDETGYTVDWRLQVLGHIWKAMSDGWHMYTTWLHTSTEDQPMIAKKRLIDCITDIQQQYASQCGRTYPSFLSDTNMTKKSEYFLES